MNHLADEIRAIIVCPRCRGPLTETAEALHCDACRLTYRIEERIPILLVGEAVPERGR